MANSPILSMPVLYTRSNLEADQQLVTQICNLINDAFSRSKKPYPTKWGEKPRLRFPSNDPYFEMLGSDGVIAVIFDDDLLPMRKAVAVAAVVPWQGGWKKEGAGVEEGWEMKAVAVDGDARYLRRGLAVQLYNFLEQHLILTSQQLGHSTTGRKFEGTDQLTLWILAAECINGNYWRRRGYELVRKDIVNAPTWGVLTSFEMVVLRRVIPFEPSTSPPSVDSRPGVDEPLRQELVVKRSESEAR